MQSEVHSDRTGIDSEMGAAQSLPSPERRLGASHKTGSAHAGAFFLFFTFSTVRPIEAAGHKQFCGQEKTDGKIKQNSARADVK